MEENLPAIFNQGKSNGFVSREIAAFFAEQLWEVTKHDFSCPWWPAVVKKWTAWIGDYWKDIITNKGVLDKLLWDITEFGKQEWIGDIMNSNNFPSKAFYAIFSDMNFATDHDAQVFMAQLLVNLNKQDQINWNKVASSYSRDPWEANYIMSIAGIPYFINITYQHQKMIDRFSTIPSMIFVPQHSFDWLRKRPWRYSLWVKRVRDALKKKYWAHHPWLSHQSWYDDAPVHPVSAIGNFLLTGGDSDMRQEVAEILDLQLDQFNSILAASLQPKSWCPYTPIKRRVDQILKKLKMFW